MLQFLTHNQLNQLLLTNMIKRFAIQTFRFAKNFHQQPLLHPYRFSFSNASQMRQKIYSVINQHGIESKEYQQIMKKFSNQMNGLFQKGDLEEGIKYYKVNLEFVERIYGSQDRHTTDGKAILAMIYSKARMFKQSAEILEQVKQILQKKEETNDHSFINVLYSLATAYNYLGKVKQAKELFIKTEQKMQQQNIDILNKLAVKVDLARIYFREKDFQKTLINFRSVYDSLQQIQKERPELAKNENTIIIMLQVANSENIHGDKHKAAHIMKHLDIGEISQKNIFIVQTAAQLYQDIGMIDDLQEFCIKCIQKLPPKHHTNYYGTLTKVYMFKHEDVKGQQACKKIFELEKQNPILDLNKTAGFHRTLASFQHAQGKIDQCLQNLNKALNIYKKINADQFRTIDQMKTMQEISGTLFRNGRLAECQKIHIQILDLLENNEQVKTIQGENKWRGITLDMLVNINTTKKQYKQALEYALKANEQFEKEKYKKEINVSVRLKHTISLLYRNNGDNQQSQKWMVKYMQAVDKNSNKNDLIYAQYLQRKGALQNVAKNYEAAEATLMKSAQIFESLAKQIPMLSQYAEHVRSQATAIRNKKK